MTLLADVMLARGKIVVIHNYTDFKVQYVDDILSQGKT
jgi:hypothetical protein